MVTSQTLRTFFYEYQTFADTNLPVLSRSITRFFTQGLEILNSLKATAWIVSKNTAAAPKEQWHQAFSSCENSNDDYSGRNFHCWWHMVVRSSNTHDDLFLRDKNKWQIVSIEEMSSKHWSLPQCLWHHARVLYLLGLSVVTILKKLPLHSLCGTWPDSGHS